MTCPQVAELLGDAPRSVEYWVRRFEQSGLAGLREGERSGRPPSLNEKPLQEINNALRQMPREVGLGGNLWDGKTLAAWIAKRYGIELGVRQCQRLFRQLGFRLRKPRPRVALADAARQKAHKKTPGADGRPDSGSVGRSSTVRGAGCGSRPKPRIRSYYTLPRGAAQDTLQRYGCGTGGFTIAERRTSSTA